MKKVTYKVVFLVCLTSILTYGCATAAKVNMPQSNLDVGSIVNSLKHSKPKEAIAEGGRVGIFLEVERSEVGYATVSNNLKASLSKAGINADLLYDENDPRLEDTRILLHIKYSQVKKQVPLSGWSESQYIGAIASGNIFGAAMMQANSYTFVESYNITIFDIKTGEEGHYYKLEEAVNALIKQLGIPLNPSTGDYYIKDSGDHIKDSGVGIAPDKYRGTDKAQTLALRAAKILALRKLFEAVKNIHVGSDKVMSYMEKSDTIRIKIENLIKKAEFIDQKDNSDGTVEISARVRFEEIRKACE
ncbi:MAG: hypothetical protein Q7J31_02920 [Syntrophales bacterium]|nr:hypothetical protein [Syntrophales bacterium]